MTHGNAKPRGVPGSRLGVTGPFFPCPRCGTDRPAAVIDSRPVEGVGIRRRRVCGGCEGRFFTVEVVDEGERMRAEG